MSAAKKHELKGIIPAIVTPMDEEGAVDHELLEKQAAYLSDAGVHGFFICGTAGEGAYLSTGEKREVIKTVRSVASGRQFLCAACIRPSTNMVLEEMKALEKTDPDFVVAVTPFYLSMRQEDIVEHFRTVARAAPAPLILYNIPCNTHNPMNLDTILELADEDNVAGVKDSSGDFAQFSRGLLGKSPDGFSWIQGEEYLAAASVMLGCNGMVSGLSNVRAEPLMDLWLAAQEGDWDTVKECQVRINHLHEITRICGNPVSPIKAATELAGRGSRRMRHRSQSLDDSDMARVEEILRDCN